jgi:putative RNA 2'-phosphotransferase
MANRQVTISKFLSLVLRHKPERIGIRLDEAGWTSVSELLAACNAHGFSLKHEELHRVVENNDKKRFAFSADGSRIRASQGHSIQVELDYAPAVPPEILYHGTAERFLSSIKEGGLIKGRRHHVHLSSEEPTARAVGQRYGKPVVLKINSGLMHEEGFEFYRSANGVWLTEHVPVRFISDFKRQS